LVIYPTNDLDETRKDTRFGISKPFFRYKNGNLIYLNTEIYKYSCSNLYSRSRFLKHITPTLFKDQCTTRVIERNKASTTIAKLINGIRILGMKKNISTLIVLSPTLTAVKRVSCKQNKGEDIHHYSPRGNALLAQTISNRLTITKTGKITIN
jgi:hypothetical protein